MFKFNRVFSTYVNTNLYLTKTSYYKWKRLNISVLKNLICLSENNYLQLDVYGRPANDTLYRLLLEFVLL